MKNTTLKNTILSAMFLALSFVLPFFTGQIQQIGSMLLPMHIPIILCSLVCSKRHGFVIGLIAPVMRSLIFQMPPMYPTAIAMSFKLAVLGFTVGFLFERARWKCIRSLYRCLITGILISRAVWGIVMAVLLGVGGNTFTFMAFINEAFIKPMPGIILQLVFVPAIMLILERTHLVPMQMHSMKKHKEKKHHADVE